MRKRRIPLCWPCGCREESTLIWGAALRIYFLLLTLFCLVPAPAPGEDLQALESIVAQAPTPRAFLERSDLRLAYREAYKKLFGYTGDTATAFDSGYERILQEYSVILAAHPEFGAQSWQLHPKWQEESVEVSADSVSSGLSLKPGVMAPFFAEWQRELAASAGQLAQRDKLQPEIDALQAIFLSRVPSKTEAEIAAMTDLERAQFHNLVTRKIGELKRDRDYSSRLDRLSQALSANLIQLPVTQARLRTPAVGALLEHLKDIEAPSRSALALRQALGLNASDAFLNLLRSKSTSLDTLRAEVAAANKSREAVSRVKNSRLPETALKELLEFRKNEPNIGENELLAKMTPQARAEYEKWSAEQEGVRAQILAERNGFEAKSRFFTYPLLEDPSRKTFRLPPSGSGGLRAVRAPRSFHAFFTGLKTGECAWAEPRRWTVAGFRGVVPYFTFGAGSSQAEGVMKVLPVHVDGGPEVPLLESSSRAVAGKITVTDGEISHDLPIWPLLLKKLQKRHPNLSVTDALNVDDQTRSKVAGLFLLAAYRHGERTTWKSNPTLVDPIAQQIAEDYKAVGNYAMPKILFDGGFDGTAVIRVNPEAREGLIPLSQLQEKIYLARVLQPDFTVEQARQWAADAGHSRAEAEAAMAMPLGDDEPSRKVLGDVMNDRAGTDQAAAGLRHYRDALRRWPGNKSLLTTRLLEGIERNATNVTSAGEFRQAADEALDAALLSDAVEVTKYEDTPWRAAIKLRALLNPHVRDHLARHVCQWANLRFVPALAL